MAIRLLIILPLISPLVRGAALYLMWGWFVTPLGIPEINYWAAVGLVLTFSLLTLATYSKLDEIGDLGEFKPMKEEDARDALLMKHIALPAFWTGAGGLIHWLT